MTGLHADSIVKWFGKHQLLTDIFLSCKKNEIVGLLGRNGSGKSTLFQIILGSLSADSKFVRVDDKVLSNVSDAKGIIKYLPQHDFLPNHIKIKKLVELYCQKSALDIVLNKDFIRPYLNHKCHELSGGEKRLLELYMIIYSEAKYVLIDEPFNGIAPIYKEEIKELIKEESKNKGFVITDHDYRNILDVATTMLLLFDGGIKRISNIEDLHDWGYIK